MADLDLRPWIATGFKNIVVNDADGLTQALCPQGKDATLETTQFRARLISASPEMFVFIEKMQSWFSSYCDDFDINTNSEEPTTERDLLIDMAKIVEKVRA